MSLFHKMIFSSPGGKFLEEQKIPRDKNYPPDAVQCDDCGGYGTAFRQQNDGPDPDCPTCKGKGWLPKDHPKGRHCSREACNKPLPPDRYQVYCSNQCALDDA